MNLRPDITLLLEQMGQDDPRAMDRVIPLVYDELRHIAQRYLAPGRKARTLNTTALVHEAYLRLVDQTSAHWSSRDHFLKVCSVVMRNLVVDFARRKAAVKRGGDQKRVTPGETELKVEAQAEQLLALDEALHQLEKLDPLLCQVVECRHFAGLTEAETARALGISERSVRRYWVKARALLHQILND